MISPSPECPKPIADYQAVISGSGVWCSSNLLCPISGLKKNNKNIDGKTATPDMLQQWAKRFSKHLTPVAANRLLEGEDTRLCLSEVHWKSDQIFLDDKGKQQLVYGAIPYGSQSVQVQNVLSLLCHSLCDSGRYLPRPRLQGKGAKERLWIAFRSPRHRHHLV